MATADEIGLDDFDDLATNADMDLLPGAIRPAIISALSVVPDDRGSARKDFETGSMTFVRSGGERRRGWMQHR